MGMARSAHQTVAEEIGVKFIPGVLSIYLRHPRLSNLLEWFAELDYSPEGKLLITSSKQREVQLNQILVENMNLYLLKLSKSG